MSWGVLDCQWDMSGEMCEVVMQVDKSKRGGAGGAEGKGGEVVVRIDNAHKWYQMGERRLHVLKGVSLAIGAGEYVAIMGPSGSGKSTLLNVLGLLDTLDAGSYGLAGEEVSGLGDRLLARARARRIGFVFQSFNLFPHLDVLQNIEVPMIYAGVGSGVRRKRARELAERVGLGHRLDHKPRQLSGGEMQRTAIARALSNAPPLLLADEPTGNLDEKTGEEIMALFDELVGGGQTLVLVTHNPMYRERCGRLLRMRDGLLEGEGEAVAGVAGAVAADAGGMGEGGGR